MAAMPGNHHETRDKMKRVQELLDQEIERVNDLKNLLSIAEENVTQLKEELDEYHARITPTPIDRCPVEILSIIFRLSIPEDANIRHMGRLLLVCKRWYTLVVNDPQMWNTINISVPAQWDMRSWSYSTRSYAESCIKRSRATSLNINLNFTLLRTTREQLIEMLLSGFIHSLDSVQAGGDCGTVEYWSRNLDYTELENDTDTTIDCLPNRAIQLIGELIGVDENIMRRAESFTLCFPYRIELLQAIWEQLAQKTINVSRLHLIGLEWDYLREIYDENDDAVHILSLPKVKDLRMRALPGWDLFLSFDPSSLHKLSVNTSFEKDFFSEIRRFDQLRTLTLFADFWDIGKDLPNCIYLPMLQELVLVGHFTDLDAVKLDLPRLKRLVVEWRMCRPSETLIMPMVQPAEVHWAPDDPDAPYFQKDILGVADTVIRNFLLRYANSDCFSVPSFLKNNALEVLRVLSTEGVLPPKWRTVSFHDKSGSIERMQVDNIVCR